LSPPPTTTGLAKGRYITATYPADWVDRTERADGSFSMMPGYHVAAFGRVISTAQKPRTVDVAACTNSGFVRRKNGVVVEDNNPAKSAGVPPIHKLDRVTKGDNYNWHDSWIDDRGWSLGILSLINYAEAPRAAFVLANAAVARLSLPFVADEGLKHILTSALDELDDFCCGRSDIDKTHIHERWSTICDIELPYYEVEDFARDSVTDALNSASKQSISTYGGRSSDPYLSGGFSGGYCLCAATTHAKKQIAHAARSVVTITDVCYAAMRKNLRNPR